MKGQRGSVGRLRAGVVPMDGVEALSVGYEKLRGRIRNSLSQLEDGELPQPLFVRGEWGTGKSHFISFVRNVCRQMGVASSVVSLNARGHALNYPQRFYPLMVKNLEIREKGLGLQQIIGDALATVGDTKKLAEFGAAHASSSLGRAVRWLCEGGQSRAVPGPDHAGWTTLLGTDLAWAAYRYKRDETLARIAGLAQLARSLGAVGLVLLFDEAETIDQLWNIRSRLGAYSVLGSLCQTPRTWCAFATTDRFDTAIGRDVNRKELRWIADTKAKWFLERWQNGLVEVMETPRFGPSEARELATRVVRLYRRAYPVPKGGAIDPEEWVKDWEASPARNPRTLIRTIVHHLDRTRPLRS